MDLADGAISRTNMLDTLCLSEIAALVEVNFVQNTQRHALLCRCLVDAHEKYLDHQDRASCPTCKQRFTGRLGLALAEEGLRSDADIIGIFNLGDAHLQQGEYDKALKKYCEVAQYAHSLPKRRGNPILAKALGIIGVVYTKKTNYPTALAVLNKSLQLKLKLYGSQHTCVADDQVAP